MCRFALVVIVLVGTVARADDTPKPWVTGVTAEQKAAAQDHVDKGTALFVDHKYADALAEYDLATRAWDHPAIRFNMVRCQVFLKMTLEAADNLDRALTYGAAPFDEAIYNEALELQASLATQVGDLDVSCAQPGVALTLDGKPLPACPATTHRRVLAGSHQLAGSKAGFQTRTIDVTVAGGAHEHPDVTLVPVTRAEHVEHRFKTWQPWVVFGGGVGLAGLGGLLHLKATSDNSTYAGTVTRECTNSCAPGTAPDASLLHTAHIENGVAIGMIAAGAAAFAAGTTMLALNRGRTITDVEVVPTHGGAAMSVAGRF